MLGKQLKVNMQRIAINRGGGGGVEKNVNTPYFVIYIRNLILLLVVNNMVDEEGEELQN